MFTTPTWRKEVHIVMLKNIFTEQVLKTFASLPSASAWMSQILPKMVKRAFFHSLLIVINKKIMTCLRSQGVLFNVIATFNDQIQGDIDIQFRMITTMEQDSLHRGVMEHF